MARRGQSFTYSSHERLREAIEKKLFADLKDVVKITTSTKTPDDEQLRRVNEVCDRLIAEQGYCPVCANELVQVRRRAAVAVSGRPHPRPSPHRDGGRRSSPPSLALRERGWGVRAYQ